MRRSLDFTEVKAGARFEQVLDYYGIEVRGRGNQRMALCPFHDDSQPSCSINLAWKIFRCFGCDAHGSILDFVAFLDRITLQEASVRVAEICGLVTNHGALDAAKVRRSQSRHREAHPPTKPVIEPQTLDPAHPYLAERGISPDVASKFGIGFCDQGLMRGRICISIHDEKGNFAGYVGRFPASIVPKGSLKYFFPPGFEKRKYLFGLHRVSAVEHLVIVEGYWSVLRLQKLGFQTVALMGRSISTEQEELLLHSGTRRLTLLLDGDTPGREATLELVPRLAQKFFVRAGMLPDREQPDTAAEKTLRDVLS